MVSGIMPSIGELVNLMGRAGDTMGTATMSKATGIGRKVSKSVQNAAKSIQDIIGPQEPLCRELAAAQCHIGNLGNCIKHPLYFSIPHLPQLNGMANRGLEVKKQMVREYREKKNWGGIIAAHEKPYRFEALQAIEFQMSRKEFWELFADVYIGCENWYQEPNRSIIADWLMEFRCAPAKEQNKIRGYMMTKEERAEFKKLPDRLRIFRGWSRDGGERGYSWSLNIEKAEWFGRRLAEHDNAAGYAYVAWGWCQKEHAIGHFTRRGESEIFIPWEQVSVSSVDIVQFASRDETRPVASFDFDGTLHSAVDAGGNPTSFRSDKLPPRKKVLTLMRKQAELGRRIVIVTRRDYQDLGPVLRFCARHRLPVGTVYPTHDKPKEPYLETIKAIVHYDDHEIKHPGAIVV